MNFLKITGWICLSTLIFFCLFVALQWITFELLHLQTIIHHICLFLIFGIASFVLPRYYGLTGGIIIGLFWITFMYFTQNANFVHLIITATMILSSVSGYLLKTKKYGYFAIFLLASGALLFYAYSRYSTIADSIIVSTDKLTIAPFNESDLVALNGNHLKLSEDTVYLVNFTFYACLPCRKKKGSLEQLKKRFENQAFRIIQIHSFEPEKFFLEYYQNDLDTYHDSGQALQKKFRLNGAPYEMLFDKTGNEVRRMIGFDSELADDYVNKTTELIATCLKK